MMNATPTDDRLYARNPDVVYRELDGAGFLVDQLTDRLFHLNETGAAIWNFLEQPRKTEEIITTMQIAFPEIPHDLIAQDIKKTFRRLVKTGVVFPTTP